MNTSNDEMESRFISKRQAWEQGYQDGQASVQHDLNLVEQQAAAQAREDENKRIVKILEDYRFGLDYPDCPPGDVIKKLVESLRTGGEP